jgi:hypothetical protein
MVTLWSKKNRGERSGNENSDKEKYMLLEPQGIPVRTTGRDDPDHDTRTVPNTTSTEQELTPVYPWYLTGLYITYWSQHMSKYVHMFETAYICQNMFICCLFPTYGLT